MKERPILFSGPMVRAILEGRKTQTRRPLRIQPLDVLPMLEEKAGVEWVGLMQREPNPKGTVFRCKFGQPGDRLWVRETWQGPLMDADTMETKYRTSPDEFHNPKYCVYAADGGPAPEFVTLDDELVCRWRPSIHMPRWACRILLEITAVRVERLQDISEADAIAEGIEKTVGGFWSLYGQSDVDGTYSPRASYRALWESINGAGSWDATPWVWVVEFKRIEGGEA